MDEHLRQAFLLDNISDAVIAADKELRVTVWNRAAERMYGWSAAEAIGRSVLEIPPIVRQSMGVDEALRRITESGELAERVVHLTKEGREIAVDYHASLLRDQQGQIEGYITVNRDVTQLEKAEEQLAYQAYLLENVSDAIVATDEHSIVTAWNKAAEDLYGWTSAEAIGRPASEVVTSKQGDPGHEESVRQIQQTGRWSGRALRYGKGSRPVYFEGTTALLKNEDGRPRGYVSVGHDVSERLQKEEQLVYQAFLLDNIADAVFAVDKQFIITAWNKAAERLYERPAQEVIGRPLFDMLDTQLTAISLEDSLHQLKTSGVVSGRAIRQARAGHQIQIDFKTEALKDAAGQVIGYASVNRDVTDLVRTQEQVTYQARLLENVGEAIIASDNDLKITYWNRAAQEIYGWTATEALGSNTTELLSTQLVGRERTQAFGDLDRLGLVKGRAIQSAKDGRRLLIDHHTVPIRDGAGQRIGIISVNRDVSEQVKAEEQLAYQANLLAIVGEAIFSTDADLRITFWNKTAERIYGWTAAEVLGKSARDLLQSKPVGKELDQVIEELHHLESMQGRTTHATKDGRRIYIDYHTLSLRDAAGGFAGVLTNNREITEQVRAEAARREVEARFRSIYENSMTGIALLDNQGIYLSCNPAFEQLLGYSQAELTGKSLFEITDPRDAELERGLFQELISGRRDNYQLEKRLLRKDGSTMWSNVVRSAVKERDGSVRFVFGMNEDISDRKRLQAELTQVRRRQFESLEADRLHLARELHDGPIQVLFGIDYQISGMLEAIGEPHASDLAFVRSQALDLINTLRHLSLELRPPDTQLYGLEQAILTHLEPFQQNFPEIAVHLNLATDMRQLSPSVQLAYYRIFQQALANTARHAQADRVDIRLYINTDRSVLEIQDNGKGFEVPNDLIVMAREGHLGLIGARERAEGVGGNLEVLSKPGHGTLIRVTAPLAP